MEAFAQALSALVICDIHRKATGHLRSATAPTSAGASSSPAWRWPSPSRRASPFPSLRLAVPPHEVPLRERSNIYVVVSLPVTWDEE